VDNSIHRARTSSSERIVVVGMTCSGKSTLAHRLAAASDAPFVELDALFWKPGWEQDVEGFPAKVAAATAGERWVVAGNYFSRTSGITWPRADTVVWVDLDMPRLLWRVLHRSWARWRSQELLWGTNTENFWTHLKLWSPDSLLHFVLTGHGRLRTRYTTAMVDPQWAHIRFVRLCSPSEVEDFARELEAASKSARPEPKPVPSVVEDDSRGEGRAAPVASSADESRA
jgi:adenylate kinase family enzyme